MLGLILFLAAGGYLHAADTFLQCDRVMPGMRETNCRGVSAREIRLQQLSTWQPARELPDLQRVEPTATRLADAYAVEVSQ